ncbi:MAG: TspO/MBR family protein, partial [Bacilli bacterium]
MKIKFKKLLIFILITFLIGNIFTLFINDFNLYNTINKAIDLPKFIFPIVWSTLYLLMSISAYMIAESNNINKKSSLILYFVQLIINSLWILLFFKFKLFLISYVWSLLLIFLVIIMGITMKFIKPHH